MIQHRLPTLRIVCVAVALLAATEARAQAIEAAHWRAGAVYTRAFDAEGWGGAVGVTHGLFSGAGLLGGLGFDVSWARADVAPDSSGVVPPHRDLTRVEAHLRTRLIGESVQLEVGLPVGVIRSTVAELPGGTIGTPALPENQPGSRWGATVGVLAAIRAPLGSRASLVAEYEISSAWAYGEQYWLETLDFAIQAILR